MPLIYNTFVTCLKYEVPDSHYLVSWALLWEQYFIFQQSLMDPRWRPRARAVSRNTQRMKLTLWPGSQIVFLSW